MTLGWISGKSVVRMGGRCNWLSIVAIWY